MKLDVDVLFAEELDNISMGFPRCDLCYLQRLCCICSAFLFLQCVSIFVCVVSICSAFLYLVVLAGAEPGVARRGPWPPLI